MNSINVYSRGFRLVKGNCSANRKAPDSVRGSVTSFSRASRLRLREFLLTRHVPDRVPVGVTLTIPEQTDKKLALECFSVAVHRLRVYFVRRCSTGFVWRVELQRNRMPHLHIIVWDFPSVDHQSFWLRLWSDIVLKLFEVPSLSAFLRCGVRCQVLDGSIAAFRYLCDHSGKSKQAQLGYVGRQWGVVGRSHFQRNSSVQLVIPPCMESSFFRHVRRLLSFSVKCPCVFGSKHVRRSGLNAVSYVGEVTVYRLLRFLSCSTSFCSDLRWCVFATPNDLPF